MAITIETDFEEYMPVYNKMGVCLSSTNSGNTNFKYVLVVTVEGESAETFKVSPDNVNSFGLEDLHTYLQAFVYPDFGDFASDNAFEYSTNTIRKFSILYQEEWEIAGVPTISQENNLQGDDKYIWEGSFPYHDWMDQMLETTPFDAYLMNASVGLDHNFLTTQKTKSVRLEDLGWSWAMTNFPTTTERIQIKTYSGRDATGSLLGTWQTENILGTSGTPPHLLRVATAPQSLNNVDAGQVLVGSQPIIDSDVVSYTCQMLDGSNVVVSELLTFNLDEECRYEVFRVHFENELGGYDAYNFRFRSQRSQTYDRSTFMSDPFNVDASGLVFKHENAQTVTSYVRSTNKIRLRSEYLTNDENEWLKQLRKTPSAYLEFTDSQGVKNFQPIAKVGGEWIEKFNSIDKLFNVEFNIEMSWSDYSQQR